MPKIQFNCANCGKLVERYHSRATRYCSQECYGEAKSQKQYEKKCATCGMIFTGTSHQVYCSRTCKRKRDHDAEKGQYQVVCPRCNAERLLIYPPRNRHSMCKRCTGLVAREKNTKRGSESALWKGGRRVDGLGYVKLHIPGHPYADSTNYVREHLAVATTAYGEEVVRQRGGAVHHIDGNKKNNQLSNLYVCTPEENADFTKQLLSLAYKLVQAGIVEFDSQAGQYSCPLLSDEIGETAQSR